MKKIYTIVSLVSSLCLMTAVSCQVENVDNRVGSDAPRVLSISPSVSNVTPSGPATKGTLVNWDKESHANIDFPTDSTFFVAAVDASGTFIPAWKEVSYITTQIGNTGLCRSMWKPTDESGKIIEYNWKPNDVKTFYAYAFVPEGAVSDATATSAGMSLHYTVPTEATAQQDLLFGYYSGIGDGAVEGKTNGTADILFHHALTSVVVKLGTLTGVATFKVTGLALEGVCAGGTGVLTPSSASEEDPADRVTWTADENGGKPVTATFTQSVSETPVPTAENTEIGEPFIVIPQSFGPESKARLKVSILVDDRPVDIYYPLKGSNEEDLVWEAGKVNIYTVDYNGHEGIQLWANGPYWATKNVGAEKPEDYGWYFSWGNVTGYIYEGNINSNEDFNNCTFKSANGGTVREGGFSSDSWETPGKELKASITPGAANDAAFANMGSKWRMPTAEECSGLTDPERTTMTYTKRNGVAGYLFTGVQEGFTRRSIFIPASGWANGEQICFVTKAAILRTSTWIEGQPGPGVTLVLGYYSDGASPSLQEDRTYRGINEKDKNYYGRVVRAVENTAY